MIGAAAMGMISTVVAEWVRRYPRANMHELLDEGFDLLIGGLGAYVATHPTNTTKAMDGISRTRG